NKLPNDGTRKSKADRHLEAAEHPCRDRGNIDLTQQDHPPAAKRPHSVDQKLIYILDAAVDCEEYKHRNEDYRESNLRRDLDAEPNHKYQREDDARNGV